MKRRSRGDVQWYLPGKKRPFAYSTQSTSELIAVLSEQFETISDVFNNVRYDQDAKTVLQTYIDKGYGQVIAREWFKF